MDFCVTTISQGLVAPSGSTPPGALDLSMIDSLPDLRCRVPALHVFKSGVPEVGKVIREALSKALLYYYPLAGRLSFSSNQLGHLQVVCSGDHEVGAWFVEASADCTLDDVDYFDDAKSIPYHKLLPPQENRDHGLDDPLVQIQVTRFGCYGFVVGIITCHSVFDGVGTGQFLKAVGEMARGAERPSITPEWRRDFLPPPNFITRPYNKPKSNPFRVEHATIDLSLDKIKDLKQAFLKWTGGMKTCSTFEVVSALIWRERTRAIRLTEEEISKLAFYASCRRLFPQLPNGFYGNCFFPVIVTAPSGTLVNMSVFRVVRLIQEAKAGVADEFKKWTVRMNYNPFEQLAPDYMTLIVTEWDGLGFKDIDYGWGKPVNLIPVVVQEEEESNVTLTPIVVLSSTTPFKAGVLRMKTWCVQQHHIQPLLRNIDNFNDHDLE